MTRRFELTPRLPLLRPQNLLGLALVALSSASAAAQSADLPSGLDADQAASVVIPSLDLDNLRSDDANREANGLPPRFAVPNATSITPLTGGTWENLDADTLLWRLRVGSPGALSMNLGFTSFQLSPNANMAVFAANQTSQFQSYSFGDNAAHGELWTPVVLADEVMIEMSVPITELDQVRLQLGSINVGYRYFGEKSSGNFLAGTCNIDVVCPQGDAWEDEINSVGVIATGGSTFCTGFMVNNTANDEKPYFMTANHCGVSAGNAASLVVYWNYQSPNCGQQAGGTLNQAQTGSFFRAASSNSDFALFELDSDPDPAWEVSFAGWSRSAGNPSGAVAIHHPSTDEKSISFEGDPVTTTTYLEDVSPGNGTHVRVEDWDVGTTEPGSSGSPLFDLDHRVIGQLHGGFAACGNDLEDWYGRFSISWDGGSSSTRLRDWLDPIGSGVTVLDTLAPGASGLRVTPGQSFVAAGDFGGPFAPLFQDYTLENRGPGSITYGVGVNDNWMSLNNTNGTLALGQTTTVRVSLNNNADSLSKGFYGGQVSFFNLTDGDGDTIRSVSLTIGIPELVESFPLDTNPGWSMQGDWEFGTPTGGGGEFGNPDPVGSFTGNNVYGYNLNGDYENNMTEQHLTSTAIDCSDLIGTTLSFARYLGVEQPLYDHAYVRVSNDGSNWTTVWENAAVVEDSAWSQVSYDISEVADGESTVFLRWTIGTTDGSWLYCGWNIDDVEISGIVLNETEIYCTPLVSTSGCLPSLAFNGTPSASAPNGFNIDATQVENNKAGIFFYGTNGPASIPFLGGTLCATPPLTRTPVQFSSNTGPACTGALTIDLNATGISADIGNGNPAWLQGWFRDPAAIAGAGLTDAVSFTVQP